MSDIGNMGLTLHLIVLVILFPPVVAFLALWRAWFGKGPARAWALVACVFAVLPLVFILTAGRDGRIADAYMGALDDAVRRAGWVAYTLPMSLPLFVSGLVRGRSGRGVDLLHVAALAGLALMWLLE